MQILHCRSKLVDEMDYWGREGRKDLKLASARAI